MFLLSILNSLFFVVYCVRCEVLYPSEEEINLVRCLKNSNVEVVTRRNERYTRINYNFNTRIITNARGFLVPSNEVDIQHIVSCGRKLHLKLRTKCGGHSFEKYSYGTDEHWVIDLNNIKYVHVDERNGIVTVGAGMISNDLTRILVPKGYILPLGICPSIGVSGFTLGGGHGLMDRTYGLMIDQVKQMKIVTADSNLLTVNETRHSDLFWALRGAGANSFGVVTEFTFNLTPAPEVLTITKFYNLDRFKEIFKLWSKWAESDPDDRIKSQLYYNFPKVNQFMLLVVIKSTDSFKDGLFLEDIVNRFPNITTSDIAYQNYTELLQSVGILFPPGYFKFFTYYVDKPLSYHERNIFSSAVLELCKYCFVFLDMFGGQVAKRNNGAFIHRESIYSVLTATIVPAELGIDRALQIGRSTTWYLDRFLYRTKTMDSGHSYQNYVDNNRTDWRIRYFGSANYKLNFVNEVYDPNNFFTCPQCV